MNNLTKYAKLTLLVLVFLQFNNTQAAQEDPFPLRSLPAEVQGEIMGHLDRQTLSRHSRVDRQTYHAVHNTNENGVRNPISEKTLNLQEALSFDLDQSKEKERLISFLLYTQTQNRLVDIDIIDNNQKKDWSQILPLCTNIRFINHKIKIANSDSNDFQYRTLTTTPLIEATDCGDIGTIQSLINRMKEINLAGFQEYIEYKYNGCITALELAICNTIHDKREVIIQLLISRGAKLDTTDNIGQTPLMLAVNEGLTNVVNAIINKMKENDPQGLQQYLNRQDWLSKTALKIACLQTYQDIALALIDEGAEIGGLIPGQNTLLIDASRGGVTKVVNFIIDKLRATDPQGLQQYLNHQDRRGKTALSFAQELGYNDIVTILQQAGATQ